MPLPSFDHGRRYSDPESVEDPTLSADRNAVRSNPLSPSSLVRGNLNHLSPSKKVDPKLKSSVRRLAKLKTHHVFSQQLAGVTMDGSYGSIAALGQARWFVDKIKAHNADVESFKDNGNSGLHSLLARK